MNAPQIAAQPAAAAPATQPDASTSTATTLEERTSQVLAELRSESSETAGETSLPPTPAGGSPAASAVPLTPEQAKAERQERLQQLKMRDRERVDHKQRQAEGDKLTRRAADLERRAAEAEALAAKRIDAESLDEASFLALAEKRGISGDRLAAWIRDAVTNPEKVAQAAALKAMQGASDPKFAALEAKLAAQEAQIQNFLAAQQEQHANSEAAQNLSHFRSYVEESAPRAPLAAQLLSRNADEFMRMADMAGESVPRGAGREALLDAVEDLLDGGARGIVEQYAELYGYSKPTTSTGKALPPSRATASAKTVSNSLAAGRTSVVEEEDWSSLDLDERARRLAKSLG